VACALGVESANPRVLRLIDKGGARAGGRRRDRSARRRRHRGRGHVLHRFPTESYAEAQETLRFLADRHDRLAAFIIGRFDLTHGALVAQDPARFGCARSGRPRATSWARPVLRTGGAAPLGRRGGAAGPGGRVAVGGLAAAPLSLGRLAVHGPHHLSLRPLRQGRLQAAGRRRRGGRSRALAAGRPVRPGSGRAGPGPRGGDLAPAGAREPPGLARRLPAAGRGLSLARAPARALPDPSRVPPDRLRPAALRRGRRPSHATNQLGQK
jgi:hypothetical protein